MSLTENIEQTVARLYIRVPTRDWFYGTTNFSWFKSIDRVLHILQQDDLSISGQGLSHRAENPAVQPIFRLISPIAAPPQNPNRAIPPTALTQCGSLAEIPILKRLLSIKENKPSKSQLELPSEKTIQQPAF